MQTLTLKPEYIAMLVFADLCALICTMCVVWLVLRIGTLMSLRSYLAQGQGSTKAATKPGRNGKGRKDAGWDDEIFGGGEDGGLGEEPPLKVRKARSAQAEAVEDDGPPQDPAEPVVYTEDDVLILMQRARDEQRKVDEAEFTKPPARRPASVRPPTPRGAGR